MLELKQILGRRGEKLQRGVQVFAFIMVGFLGLASGYIVAGGITKQAEHYAYGETITCGVKIEDLGIDTQVQLFKGMTPFDALLRVASLKTTYYESMGASIVTEIDGLQQSWGYKINGESPTVGMQDYQLRNDDNLELFKLEW